ncbi:MAG: hypothetical protein Q7K43_00890 [Candidatus Woesearchaeota archaeon]|nr:hypothetical protein [Candidatus Woesearchaeota archaeon]
MRLSINKIQKLIREAVDELNEKSLNDLFTSAKLVRYMKKLNAHVKGGSSSSLSSKLEAHDISEADDDEPKYKLPPRRTRTKGSLTMRESGIVAYGLSKLLATPTPDVEWFKENFSPQNIEQALVVVASYVTAAFEEFEAARPHLAELAASGDEKAQKELDAFDKASAYMEEQRSKGHLENLDGVVNAIKAGHAAAKARGVN